MKPTQGQYVMPWREGRVWGYNGASFDSGDPWTEAKNALSPMLPQEGRVRIIVAVSFIVLPPAPPKPAEPEPEPPLAPLPPGESA